MGRLGYQSDAQASLAVSYNSLESYGASLQEALTQPYPPYEAIGIRNPGGEYNQLATSLLQIENEFYGTIRPKRVIRPGERPLHALRERGVEYVEVRCMDLDPFVPVGIAAPTMRFLDIFLLHCLLPTARPTRPRRSPRWRATSTAPRRAAASRGCSCERGGARGRAGRLGRASCSKNARRSPSALDAAHGGSDYRDALARGAARRWRAPDTLPSARVLSALQAGDGCAYTAFVQERSVRAQAELLALPWSPEQQALFEREAQASLDRQRAIEAADTMPFETFRQDYVSAKRLMPG